MASKLKLTELLYPTSTTAAITINSDDSVTIPTQSTTNLAYTGTLTGGTGVVNLGSGQFYKDASGNVGIGTSSPTGKLHVNGGTFDSFTISGNSTNSVGMRIQNSAASSRNWNIISSGGGVSPAGSFSIYDDTAAATRMSIDSSGNVGIGTSSPSHKLSVNKGSAGVIVNFTDGVAQSLQVTTGSGYVGFLNPNYGAITFRDGSNAETVRITDGGNLLVGTQNALISSLRRGISVLAPSGTFVAAAFANDGGASAQTMDVWNKATSGNNSFIAFSTEASATERGSISYNRAGGLTVYNTTSDRRAKDILGNVTDSGELVDSLKVYNGIMKGATIARPMLIADEAQAITPYAVTGEKDAVDKDGNPVFQQIDVSSYVPLLIAELQSLRKRVAELESI
jgi:hypothetical protein